MSIKQYAKMKGTPCFFICFLFAMGTMVTSCSSDDGEDVDTPDPSPAPLGSAYIVQNIVQAPDVPRTVYVNIISSLTDEVDLTDAFEFNGSIRARAFNGKVYVHDSESVQVIKYDIDENNTLLEEGRFSMAQH